MSKNLDAQDEINAGIDMLEAIFLIAGTIADEPDQTVSAIQRVAMVAQEKLEGAVKLLQEDLALTNA